MIPALGPFLFIPEASHPGEPWLIIDGCAQTAGLLGFIAGLAMREKRLVYYAHRPGGRSFALAPQVGPRSLGLWLTF